MVASGLYIRSAVAVISELMQHADCPVITARHDPRNPNSGAVMRKCGMTRLGVRHGDHNNQGECDAVVYGINRSERMK